MIASVALAFVAACTPQEFTDPIEAITTRPPVTLAPRGTEAMAVEAAPLRSRLAPIGKREAWSTGKFALGYIFKELITAATEGRPDRLKKLASADPWVDMGVFAIGARAAERASSSLLTGAVGNFAAGEAASLSTIGVQGLFKAVGRTAIPLIAGAATVQLARTGQVDAGELSGTVARGLLASAALHPIDLVLRSFAYKPLLSMGTPGIIAIGALEVAKIAGALYLMDRIETSWRPTEFEDQLVPSKRDGGVVGAIDPLPYLWTDNATN